MLPLLMTSTVQRWALTEIAHNRASLRLVNGCNHIENHLHLEALPSNSSNNQSHHRRRHDYVPYAAGISHR
jgi:hypothetical protein